VVGRGELVHGAGGLGESRKGLEWEENHGRCAGKVGLALLGALDNSKAWLVRNGNITCQCGGVMSGCIVLHIRAQAGLAIVPIDLVGIGLCVM